ncbi:ATP-dependent DNA helicase [Alloscardovia omnicolens]|uniref:ATP-dependent DNA helicase n=1 Tax=Alloscardovia omnicolens TaxID=419015 RepID=UPI003A687093
MTEISYTPEQEKIISAQPDASMLIVAGAGSGKTFTMTQRIIELIKRGVSPEKILGLTFTNAAATELLTRVSAEVFAHRQQSSVAHSDEEQLENADSAFLKPEVYTYDAFFQSIVRQFGLLVGMDPQTVPLSEAGTYQLADAVVQDHIRQAVADMRADGDESSSATDELESIGSYSTFVSHIVTLSDAISNSMIDGECTSMDDAIARVEHWDTAFIEHLEKIIDRDYAQEKNLPDFGQPIKMTSSKTEKGLKKWIDNKGRDYVASLVVQLKEKTQERSTLLRYVKLFHQKKQEQHVAQFADFTIAAIQLVDRFPWIAQYYRSRFTHVFLDEYQDSSSVQANLIVRIFAPEGVQHENSSALTAVGDPYQAIYGWRGASPGAFINFLRNTGVHAPLALSASMRNPQIILDMANMLTRPLRLGHVDVYNRPGSIVLQEVTVKELTAHTPQGASNPAEGSFGALIYHTQRQEIDAVVRYAKYAVSESKRRNDERIKRGEKAQSGPFVAVLMRSKTHMDEYASALTRAGLSVQIDGVGSVLDRPDAHEILNILRVVSNHRDSAAAVNLLASTRFSLSAKDLRALSQAATAYNTAMGERLARHVGVSSDEKSSYDALSIVSLADVLLSDNSGWILDTYFRGSDAARQRIDECSRMLRRIEASHSAGVEQTIHLVGEELGLDIDIAVAYASSRAQQLTTDATPISSVDSLVELAQTYSKELMEGQSESISGFLSWLEGQKNSLPKNPTLVGSDNADVIVCTIHHAKGLEWDSVIIPHMQADTFPSKTGNNFACDAVYEDEPQRFGQYAAHASIWLTNPDVVPHPVRSDKDAISRFADADEFDQIIPDAWAIEKRVYDQMHLPRREEMTERMSMREESGQTVLEEERRLAYVAVTRAKRDVLITGYLESRDDLTDELYPIGYTPEAIVDEKVKDKLAQKFETRSSLSVFLNECYEYVESSTRGHEAWRASRVDVSELCADSGYVDAPRGFFVGDLAADYAKVCVSEALQAADNAQPHTEEVIFAHPRKINPAVGDVLTRSQIASQKHELTQDNPAEGSLLQTAQRVHETISTLGFIHAQQLTDDDVNAQVIEQARRVQASRNTSVTAVQKEVSTAQNTYEHLVRARAIMRPVPNLSSYENAQELTPATLGTVFHAFAQRYFSPSDQTSEDNFALMRESLRAQVESEEPANELEERMHEWKKRLIESAFNPDDCIGTEIPFAYAPETRTQTIVGIIDAVFEGEIFSDSPIAQHAHEHGHTIQYTIIDWKTGHRPISAQERKEKLLQIDMYRQIWATLRGVSIDNVDAALYYVSEEDERKRSIYAQYKTAEQIEQLFAMNQ